MGKSQVLCHFAHQMLEASMPAIHSQNTFSRIIPGYPRPAPPTSTDLRQQERCQCPRGDWDQSDAGFRSQQRRCTHESGRDRCHGTLKSVKSAGGGWGLVLMKFIRAVVFNKWWKSKTVGQIPWFDVWWYFSWMNHFEQSKELSSGVALLYPFVTVERRTEGLVKMHVFLQ